MRGRETGSRPNLSPKSFACWFRRYETFQHSKRVAAYSRLFGGRCGLPPAELDHLELGALLHDIGKIGIPRNVLLKPDSLNEEEWRVMKAHPQIGYGLLSEFPAFQEEARIVLSHHERFDGKGYPRGKSGREIPVGARIFSIVDTLDAITSDRPYRAAQSFSKAQQEIEKVSGTQFDPLLVDVFERIPVEDLRKIKLLHPDEIS
jgi:HD-GYP domain-containing protein (c-di-GMP phosphodiesterase class II)